MYTTPRHAMTRYDTLLYCHFFLSVVALAFVLCDTKQKVDNKSKRLCVYYCEKEEWKKTHTNCNSWYLRYSAKPIEWMDALKWFFVMAFEVMPMFFQKSLIFLREICCMHHSKFTTNFCCCCSSFCCLLFSYQSLYGFVHCCMMVCLYHRAIDIPTI